MIAADFLLCAPEINSCCLPPPQVRDKLAAHQASGPGKGAFLVIPPPSFGVFKLVFESSSINLKLLLSTLSTSTNKQKKSPQRQHIVNMCLKLQLLYPGKRQNRKTTWTSSLNTCCSPLAYDSSLRKIYGSKNNLNGEKSGFFFSF